MSHSFANDGGKLTTRSWQLCAAIDVVYSDFTSGTGLAICTLPVGGQVTGGAVTVTTNWDSGTSAGMEIGDASDDNRYMTTLNLLVAGSEYSAITNAAGYAVATSTQQDILAEVTEAGTAATAGAARIVLLYVDTNKADENYE